MHREKEAWIKTGNTMGQFKKDTYDFLRILTLELNLQCDRVGDQSMKVVPSCI